MMRKHFSIFTVVISFLLLHVACSNEDEDGTDAVIGTVSFASTQTWTVGSQTWSDAVQATGCDKTEYNGNAADCRSNLGYKGNLFSWYAVNRYATQLCPSPWRVPTREDFNTLHSTLSGQDKYATWAKYTSVWGGQLGSGSCNSDGTLYGQNTEGKENGGSYYWSQSAGSTGGYYLYFNRNSVLSQAYTTRHDGFTLRCVKQGGVAELP